MLNSGAKSLNGVVRSHICVEWSCLQTCNAPDVSRSVYVLSESVV